MATLIQKQSLIELYVGWFNRVPDSNGLNYWVDQIDNGISLNEISARFFGAASVQFSAETGYTVGMSDDAFITQVYEGVFGRSGAEAPNATEIAYWKQTLNSYNGDKGTLVVSMIKAFKEYDTSNEPELAALQAKFANKVAVAQELALEQGLNLSIADGKAVLMGVTENPATVTAAIAIGSGMGDASEVIVADNVFTLTENTVTTSTTTQTTTLEMMTMWGTPCPTCEGGMKYVPLTDLMDTIETIAGLDFIQLGLINVANGADNGLDNGQAGSANSSVQAAAAIVNITVNNTADGTSTITVTNADGTVNTAEVQIADFYMDYITSLLFDANGNSRLSMQPVHVGQDGTIYPYAQTNTQTATTAKPIILTTGVNNGGTEETGYTTAQNDLIVAGRLDLLHGAYIDAGAGVNTLEIDAKGYFAQPKELLNIQHIKIENLPNVYTDVAEGGDFVNGYPDVNETAPAGIGSGANSIIDISRAGELETLTITEGAFEGQGGTALGNLTVAGVRNNAELILEGEFTQDLTVHYSEGMSNGDNGVNITLRLGDTTGATFDILANSATVNIDSQGGGNAIDASFGNSSLMNLNISGDAKLEIAANLATQFQANTPAFINAAANTAGVDLLITGFTDEVHFIGSTGNDHLDVGTARNVTVVGQQGDNEFNVSTAEDITITSGNGNNQIIATSTGSDVNGNELDNEDVVTVTVGNGANDITVSAVDKFVVTAGDGANRIEATATQASTSNVTEDDYSTIMAGNGQNEIDVTAAFVNVTAGNGANEIAMISAKKATITTGTGNDVINAAAVAGSSESITINAADGNNTITVTGFETANITTGTGNDTVTVIGGNANLGSADGGSTLVGENSNETLLNINLSTGTNTLVLGADGSAADIGITALKGSVITGENITLKVESDSDLSRATLTGVTAVQITNADVLTLTVSQFEALGAAAFSLLGESLGANGVINLIVDKNTNMTTLGLDNLSRNIDVSFEVKDGMTLTMTAQQLHERVTDDGVTTFVDNNGDFAVGTVVITNAGEDFDAFDMNLTGSVDPTAGLNVRLDAIVGGYERPADATVYTRLVVDTDNLTNGVLNPFDTDHTFLRITGDADMVFTPVAAGIDEWGQSIKNAGDSIQLGGGTENYKVDFSSVVGTVTGLTFDNFENADAIYGNGDARVDVKMAADVATAEQGLISSGISTFVVVDSAVVAGNEVNFYTCETTKDLQTLGIQGLANETVNFLNTERGVNFLIETEYSKANGYVAGTLHADFARAGADAVVNIVAKNAVPAGQSQVVQGIKTNDAVSLTVNVTGGNTVISTISDTTSTDTLESLTFTANANLTVTTAIADAVKSIDASGVVGNFTASTAIASANLATDDFVFVGSAGDTVLTFTQSVTLSEDSSFASAGSLTLNIDGTTVTVNLTAADLSGVDAITVGDSDAVVMTIAQTVAMGEANITGTGTLTLVGLGEEAFSLANYDQDLVTNGVTLTIVDVDGNGIVTLNPATNLTGVNQLSVPQDVTLNLTAAQFQQLANAGTITGTAGTTDYTVNITGLTQANANTGLDITAITADSVSITLAESVATVDNGTTITSNLANTGALTINIGDNLTFTHNDTSDLDGATINGGASSTLRLTEATNANTAVSAANWDVTTLQIDQAYVAGQNVDGRFTGLLETVTKEIYSDFGVVVGQDQIVNLEAGMTVIAGLTFNRVETNVEIENFTLNMQGGVILNGSLDLRSNDEADGGVDFLHAHLQSLTINSTGTAENEFLGGATNIIIGNVTAVGDGAAETQNNLLDVTINATQDLEIRGDFVFTSATADDNFAIGDDTAATATVTINGTADVDLGTIDSTDDDVDAVVINNTGTGSVTVGLDAAKLDQAANNTDSLSFTGSNINLQIAQGGNVDLSDDDLSGVATITVGTAADTNASSVTLTQAQYNGLTLVNGTDAGSVATLNLVEFGSVAFDATAVDADAITITMAAGVNTLNPATNLTGVTSITVPEGGTLNLTAAQFQQLNGAGTINILNTDGNAGNDAITVNITDLTQADIFVDANGNGAVDADENFNLVNVTVGAGSLTVTQAATAATITLGVFNNEGLQSQALDAESIANLNGAAYIMGANQTLELVTSVQADGLEVTGGADSAVKFRFDALNPAQVGANNVPSIDVSGYDVSELHTMNTMYNTANAGLNGEQNVEVILSNLDSAVELVIYNDPLALGLVDARNRVVTIEADTVVNGELVFNDIQTGVEITTLNLTFEGGASIAGDLRIPTIDEGSNLQAANFGTLTIVSNGAAANSITGNITAEAGTDVPTTVADIENRLLNVVINATADMVIGTYDSTGAHTSGGDIIFTSLVDGGTANLTVTGTANVTMHGVDTTDNDDNGAATNTPDIAVLNITNNSTGTLTMTGGSEAITATGTQTINFIGSGDIVLGSDDDNLGNNLTGESGDGVASTTLTSINAATMTGDLTLDTLLSVNVNNFTFTAGTGVTSLTVEANGLDSVTPTPDSAGWTFNMTNAADGSELHLNFVDPTTLVDGSKLTVLADNSTTIYIDKTMDLSDLDLSLPAGVNIVVADGATLTLTAEQASGLTIIGADGADSTGVVMIVDMMNSTVADPIVYNFAGISADVAGVATLGANDVTLNAATDLGTFTVQLTDIDSSDTTYAGQTIRFATVAQADNAVRVGGFNFGEDTDSGAAVSLDIDNTSSTNVVWLFSSVAAPVNTSGYDAEIGRLWLTEALANGANIEQLFTSLPSSIVRVDFADLTELEQLLTSGPVDRVVELASFTSLPAGLTFVDENVLEHVRTLTLNMGGEVEVGNLVIGNLIDNTGTYATPVTFNGLTINSVLADDTGDLLARAGFDEAVNVKPTSGNTIGDISVGANATNNTAAHIDLLSVVVATGVAESTNNTTTTNANVLTGTSMTIGTITFDAETAGSTATFRTTGANDVTVASLNTTDAQISILEIDHNSTGTLTITGASPAAAVDNTEQLIITAAGDVVLGTAGDAAKPGINGGGELSLIRVTSAADKSVDLGAIQAVDTVNFTLNGATSVVYEVKTVTITDAASTDRVTVTINGVAYSYTLTAAQSANDARDALIASINADASLAVTATAGGTGVITLTADNAGEHFTAAVSEVGDARIGVAATAPTNATVATLATGNSLASTGVWVFSNTALTIANGVTVANGGDLTLTSVALTVDGNVNLSPLADGLTITSGSIEVVQGAVLTLTAAQANGLTITGAGTVNVTLGAQKLGADLGGIMTAIGDTGTVTLAISTADDADIDATETADVDTLPEALTFTGSLGVADVTITGTGSVTLGDAVVTTGANRDNDVLTPNDLPSFVVTGATLNLNATQANDLSISGTGTTAVDINTTTRASDAITDLSGITSTTRTALVSDNSTLATTANLGTVVVSVADAVNLTAPYTVVTGKTINEVAAPAGTGTLSVLLAATDAAADISTITTNMADTQVTAVVTDTMIFTGDFDGANVQVNADVTADATADTINLTTSADRLSGLTVTGVDTGAEDTLNLVITDLASNLSADLNGITGLDSITASFATTGVFAGTLPTDAVITIEDGVVMTTNATNAIAADFVEATPGTGTDGTLTVTVGAADAGANLLNINSGAVNPVTVNSITVVENLTFVGTLVNGVRIADGVTMSVAADRIDGITVNAAGTTGAVTVDATTVSGAPLTLAGSADYTVNALGAALVATAVTGDLDVTTGATGVSIALGAGTNTVNANALTAGQTVTVTGNDTAATIDTVNGNITASGVTDADADTTTGGLVLNGGEGQNTITGSANNDIINGGIDADVLSGGAGNDTFIYDATLDVVTGEQINGGNGIDTIQVNTANSIDFSVATINADVEILDLTTVGISANVTITGTQLNNFSIVNAETADNIRIDELASGVTYDATLATDTFVFVSGSTGQALATAVTLTDFAANDRIQAGTGSIAYTEVDGFANGEAAFLTNADNNFNSGRDIYVEYNANGSGNAWVMVDMNGDGTVNAGDVFIVLTGVNTAGEIDSANFI